MLEFPTLLVFRPFISPNLLFYPSPPSCLLLCYPLETHANTHALVQAGATERESKMRQTASGWLMEFTAPWL